MPYELIEYPNLPGQRYKRWKVCKKGDKNKCFSKEPLTKTRAKKQMRAIYSSESNPRGKLKELLLENYNFDSEEINKELKNKDMKEIKNIITEIKIEIYIC